MQANFDPVRSISKTIWVIRGVPVPGYSFQHATITFLGETSFGGMSNGSGDGRIVGHRRLRCPEMSNSLRNTHRLRGFYPGMKTLSVRLMFVWLSMGWVSVLSTHNSQACCLALSVCLAILVPPACSLCTWVALETPTRVPSLGDQRRLLIEHTIRKRMVHEKNSPN